MRLHPPEPTATGLGSVHTGKAMQPTAAASKTAARALTSPHKDGVRGKLPQQTCPACGAVWSLVENTRKCDRPQPKQPDRMNESTNQPLSSTRSR